MRQRLLKRVLTPIFLTLCLFAFGVQTASATHFLGGKITWTRDLTFVGPNIKIDITVESSWRRSFSDWSPPNPIVGQVVSLLSGGYYQITLTTAAGQQQSYNMPLAVVSVNAAEDWFVGRTTFSVVLAPSQFPVTVHHTQCCRSSTLLEGNRDQPGILQSVIDITKGTRSPSSTALPRVYLEANQPASFQIPSTAFDGFTNVFSIAPVAESGLISGRPVGTSACTNGACSFCLLNPGQPACTGALAVSNDGLVTWTPQVVGHYAVQFKITSRDAQNNAKNSMPVDMLLEVRAQCLTCPKVIVSVPQASYTTTAGVPFTFDVLSTGNNLATSTLSLNSTPLPGNATLITVSNPPVAPMISRFHWTPAQSNVGSHFVCFQATAFPSGVTSLGQTCVTINVTANQPPQVQCVAPAPVTATQPGGAVVDLQAALFDPEHLVANWSFSVNSFNLPGGAGSIAAGAIDFVPVTASANFPIGTTLVTFRGSDAFQSGSCAISVTVNRIEQQITFAPPTPVSFGSGPIPLIATSTAPLPVTIEVVSGPGAITPGTMLAIGGVGVIELKATQPGDATYAPAAVVPAMITVVDATAPVIAPHGIEQAEATGPAGAPLTYTSPSFTDDVDAPGTASCAPVSGSTFAVGDNLVTCTVSDAAGNTGSSTFVVRITDTTPPSFGPAENVSTPATSPQGAAVFYTVPAASDLVDGAVSVDCGAAPGAIFPQGTTTVSCTASDAHNNAASVTFTITVTNASPSISAPAGASGEATSALGAAVSFVVAASDIEDGALTPSCVPASNSVFPIGTTVVTCTAADVAGAGASAAFSVTVRDTTAPVVSYSGNAGSYSLGDIVNITCAASDAVGVTASTCANISGPAYSFAAGINTFSATASDAAGNTGSASTAFNVVATLQGLQQLVNSFCTDPGVCAGLNAKLSAAANAANGNARAGQLGAFENQVQAQAGKCMTPQQAALLRQLVQQFY